MKVRTRFAPSPTGYIHVGNVRTALFAWLFAKKYNGQFILRLEDTDTARTIDDSIDHIYESLKWLGIEWGEGPDTGGKLGPYVQSQRLDIYKKWAEKLIKKGLAYSDPYSQKEVQTFRDKASQNNKPFLFRNHRPDKITVADDWYGEKPLRFYTPIKKLIWHDEVWGDMHAGEEALDDFILIKADGYPTYNFAHVIDDHLMEISHVLRGEEFLASVPKFLALSEALAINVPILATVPSILGPGGNKKLSKRAGGRDILEYRDHGYLPEAMFNYIASLGWNDGTDQEIYTTDEIVKKFDLKRIQKSGAKFDETKLDWVNWQHLALLAESNSKKLFHHLADIGFHSTSKVRHDNKYLENALKLAMTKARNLNELKNQLAIFINEPNFKLSTLQLEVINSDLNKSEAKTYLQEAIKVLEEVNDFSSDNIESALRSEMSRLSAQPRAFLNLIRTAVSGSIVSPTLFEMLETLGKEKTIKRLKAALSTE